MINTCGLRMPDDIRNGVTWMGDYVNKAKAEISELPGSSMREIETQRVLDNNFEHCDGR